MPITPVSFHSRAGQQPPGDGFSAAAWAPGTVVMGRYTIGREIGRGGGGVVLQARDEVLGRDVAMKVVTCHGPLDDLALARFRREAQSAAKLQHPGIVVVHEAGAHEGRPFLVMDLVSGGTVASKLERPLAPREAAEIAEQIARALEHAHARGVVHRDVKPENILLDAGRARLTDFGLARGRNAMEEMRLTATGEIVGTPLYMAPEQANEAVGAIGPWTDVWALGAVLYAMLTGGPPFPEQALMELLLAIQRDRHPPVRRLRPDAPPALEAIVDRCLRKRPSDRFPSAGALARELERFLDGAPSREDSGAFGLDRAALARTVAAVGVAVVATALVAGAIGWRAGRSGARDVAHRDLDARRAVARAAADERWDALGRARSAAKAAGADEDAPGRALAAGLEAMRAAAALAPLGDPEAVALARRAASATADLAVAAGRIEIAASCAEQLRSGGDAERAAEVDLAVAQLRARRARDREVDELMDQARAARWRGDDEGALAIYGRAIALDPQHLYSRIRRGEHYLRRDQIAEALADFDAAIAADPKSGRALRGRASARVRNRDFRGAIADLTQAVEADPNDAESFQTRGFCHWSLEDLTSAIADHTRALEIAPDYLLARYNRGFCYWQRGEHEKAIADFDGVTAREPRHGLAYLYRGQAWEARGELARAATDYEQATRLLQPGSGPQREAEALLARAAAALGR